MSLEPAETAAEPKKKRSKKARARDLALRYKELPYDQAKTKIMEDIPCSRSTAIKALKWVQKEQAKEKAVKPSLEVVAEEEKKPEFLEKPIEEIPIREERALTELPAEQVTEQLEIFKSMLRGLHVILFAEDGLVDMLIKGGVEEKQAHQVSDQLYRWLTRRYPPEELERFDTILLVASYGTLAGTVVRNALKKREKKSASKKS